MQDEIDVYERDRQGTGNFGTETKWGKPLKKKPKRGSLQTSPPWNRYSFHEGHKKQ